MLQCNVQTQPCAIAVLTAYIVLLQIFSSAGQKNNHAIMRIIRLLQIYPDEASRERDFIACSEIRHFVGFSFVLDTG